MEILYVDAHIAVAVKPAGVLSQDSGENSMPQLLKNRLDADQVFAVHRLDREVGGVMVFALTRQAAAALSRAIQDRAVEKTYLAVLRGKPQDETAVLQDLLFHDRQRNKTYVVNRQRKGVKDAMLSYLVLEQAQEHTLVQVQLYTGRTHQIRVQFASRKLPLVGDEKYGGKECGSTLALWCHRLSFPHPVSGQQLVFTKLPPPVKPWCRFFPEK